MTMKHIEALWKASDQLKIDRLPKEADLDAFIRAYLDARGLVMVPKEPTQGMVDAYWTQSGESRKMKDRVLARSLRHYEVFLAAAPDPFGETQ